jgi:hypothetical protein
MATIQSTPLQPRIDPSMASAVGRPTAEVKVQQEQKSPAAVVVKDPAAMMADMAEELGFITAEAAGGADETEEEQDAAFDDLISELIRKSMEALQKAQPADGKDDAKDLRDQIVRAGTQGRPGQQLDEALRQFTGGSSQKGLALMAQLAEMAKTDPELQRLGFGTRALEDYAVAHEAGLTAALNIAGVLAEAAPAVPDTAQRMLSMYEDSIAASQSVLQTFQRLGQSEGIATVNDWRKFLTEAVAADLAKQNSGGEKVQLQLILQELKGFRTFNTLTQGLDKLGKVMPKGQGPEPARLMQSTLNYIEQPLREMPGFESMARDLSLQKQILFFQGFRNLLKSIPDDAFASPEQKAGTLVPLQKRVDDLTWTEEV